MIESQSISSDVVKPNSFGYVVSYFVFGILSLLVVGGAFWLLYIVSPVAGMLAALVLIMCGYFGLTYILEDIENVRKSPSGTTNTARKNRKSD